MKKKPKKGEYLEVLLRSPKTVFTTKDVALLWEESRESTITARLDKYVRAGKLIRVRRGFYAKDQAYNLMELTTRIYTPSYISFETVLGKAGVTFQYYSQIFVASYKTKELEIDGQTYVFKKIKDEILESPIGIESTSGYSVATVERGFLDTIYLNKTYYFDNLRPLNWEKVYDILPIYGGNKRMEKVVRGLKEKSAIQYKEFLETLVSDLEKMSDRDMLSGLGELVETEKQKEWIRSKLKTEVIFLLKLALDLKIKFSEK